MTNQLGSNNKGYMPRE